MDAHLDKVVIMMQKIVVQKWKRKLEREIPAYSLNTAQLINC